MKKNKPLINLILTVLTLVVSIVFIININQPSYEITGVEMFDGTKSKGTKLTEEELKKEVSIIARNGDLQTQTNIFDVYENNGITAFTFLEEQGYKKGGVTLDFAISKAYEADREVLKRGCIEVEYVIALWMYISERELPYRVDGIHVGFNALSAFDWKSSWEFTYFSITESEFQSLLMDDSLHKMNENEKIKYMAKVWCEKNNYQRKGTEIQPYTID